MHKRSWSNIAVIGAALLALAACSDAADEAATAPVAAEAGGEVLPEIPVMGPERRILAFGDSLFAGYGLAPRDSYPEKLENALRAKGVMLTVGAAAAGAAGGARSSRAQPARGGNTGGRPMPVGWWQAMQVRE